MIEVKTLGKYGQRALCFICKSKSGVKAVEVNGHMHINTCMPLCQACRAELAEKLRESLGGDV